MGSDFVEKATPTFKKTFDRGRVELATADLFKQNLKGASVLASAEVLNGASLEIGECLTVQREAGEYLVRRGNSPVARLSADQPEIFLAVDASCNVSKAIVDQTFDLAKMAELRLC